MWVEKLPPKMGFFEVEIIISSMGIMIQADIKKIDITLQIADNVLT